MAEHRRIGGFFKGLFGQRWLILLTVVVSLALSAITTLTMLAMSLVEEGHLLDGYIDSLPRVTEESVNNLDEKNQDFEKDYRVRGDIATILFDLYDLPDDERLEEIKKTVAALDITLTDEDGDVVATTRGKESSKLTPAHMRAITVATDTLIDFNSITAEERDRLEEAIGEEVLTLEDVSRDDVDADGADVDDASSYIGDISFPMVYRARLNDGRTLIIELDNTAALAAQAEQMAPSGLLKRILAYLDGFACLYDKEMDDITAYPLSLFDEDDWDRLSKDLADTFERSGRFINLSDLGGLANVKSDLMLINLVDDTYFAAVRDGGEGMYSVLVAVPVTSFMVGILLSLVAVSVFLACSLTLLAIYEHHVAAHERIGEVPDVRGRYARLGVRSLVGFFIVAVSSAMLSCMLTTLESNSITATVTRNKRESLEYEITYHDDLTQRTLDQQVERSITQTNALAEILSKQPSLRSRQGLMRLAEIVGADYLLLFDKGGNEVCASNTLTGLTVTADEKNPMSVYQSVLHGRPYTVTDSAVDEDLGTISHTVASLIVDAEGLPDGFLVMAVDDTEVMETTERDSLPGVVSAFATLEDQVAFVVDDESEKFVAHSDSALIDLDATDYIDKDLIGRNFDGFTWYDGIYSFLSERTREGESIIVASHSDVDIYLGEANIWYICLPTIVLFGLYYLAATFLVVRHPVEIDEDGRRRSPLAVLPFGYVTYFCALAAVASYYSARGLWPSFSFVFDRQMQGGFHLFSLFSAIFFVAITLAIAFVLRAILVRSGTGASPHVKTFIRLAHSLVAYVAALVLLFGLLYLFGVDTATLLASAGIVSIALGMGSKDLVTDMLAGIFLIFEGTIHVGDFVEIGNWHGRVTDMGIRTCSITNENNDVKIITNSNVYDVVNKSLSKSIAMVDFEVPRDIEIGEVEQLFKDCIRSAEEEIPKLVDNLNYAGIVGLTDSIYTVRLVFTCNEVDRQYLTTRLRTTVQLALEAAGKREDTTEEKEGTDVSGDGGRREEDA